MPRHDKASQVADIWGIQLTVAKKGSEIPVFSWVNRRDRFALDCQHSHPVNVLEGQGCRRYKTAPAKVSECSAAW
jgi:hypothetical protein